MTPLAQFYRELHHLELSLMPDGRILIVNLRPERTKGLYEPIQWLADNREHAINRLKSESVIRHGRRDKL